MMKKKITAKIDKVIKPKKQKKEAEIEVPLDVEKTEEIDLSKVTEEIKVEPQDEQGKPPLETVSQSFPQKVDPETFEFPLNTRFTMFGEVFVVKKVFKADNTDFREIVAKDTEVLELRTLRKDAAAAKDFMIVG